ncbi:MAG: HEAT repeat domain-containing protein, partial [Planctomycetales bacterium]|nr:HEAT repeat domain-containing protein [Planctomycetales bacterium]
NPIIQHGEVDFRDERRDHVHGRIWRITAKNRDLIPVLNLETMSTSELVPLLASPEPWRKQQARIVLQDKGAAEVLPALNAWLESLPADHPELERLQLEALWMCQSLDEWNLPLLEKLLAANEPHVKAAAVRVLSHWQWNVPNSLEWLAKLAQDPFARVRLEAVRALALSDSPAACPLAMAALDFPVDRYLDFALWLTARDTQDRWLPALKNGEIDFGGNAHHLTFALQAIETPDVSAMLLSLLQQNNFPEVARANILRTVATTSVQPQELMAVLIECIDGPLPSAARANLLETLTSATGQKKLVPAGAHGNLQELESLVKPDEGQLAAAALKAIGQWNSPNALARLQNVVQNTDYPVSLQMAALDGLSRLPNQQGTEILQSTAENAEDSPLRIFAAARLIESNRQVGVATSVKLLSQLSASEDPAELVRSILANRETSSEFAAALTSQKVAADVAKLALRTIGSSGQQSPELTASFRSAGGLDEATGWNLTAEQKNQLLAEVAQNGDAASGEQIFRREKLQCFKCHAIGSAGGQVGPELGSIGGSAQTDYLLESLLEPNAKIKENYHSLVVVDNSGKVISGIKVRETPTDLILRNAENQEVQIPLSSIDETEDGGSLMPQGLMDELTRSELIHLVRFLSSLGKDPSYSLGTTAYLRNWQFMLNHHDTMLIARSGGAEAIAADSDKLLWQDRYSLVNGQIPLANVHDVLFAGSPKKTLRSRFETPSAKSLRIDAQHVVSTWLDGKMVDANSPIPVPSGTHELILVLDGQKNAESFAAWLE